MFPPPAFSLRKAVVAFGFFSRAKESRLLSSARQAESLGSFFSPFFFSSSGGDKNKKSW